MTARAGRSADTKAKLIEAGERLFGDRGVTAVSLREINVQAGQRNTSALHYHFGSRDGLLRAILAPHLARLRARRAEMIERAQAERGGLDVDAAAEILVVPFAEYLAGGASERAFVKIARQLTIDPNISNEEVQDLLDEKGISEALDAIDAALTDLPNRLRRERAYIAMMLVIHAVADRATFEDAGERRHDLPLPEFTATLRAMFVGALTAEAARP
jgi:AcrR family transcriptional regulator